MNTAVLAPARRIQYLGPRRYHVAPSTGIRGTGGPALETCRVASLIRGHRATSTTRWADDAVDALLGAGSRLEDVTVLTTGSRHSEQVEREGGGGSGAELPDERAPAAGGGVVWLSRANDELVVCGDPAVVRAVGGEALARLLGC